MSVFGEQAFNELTAITNLNTCNITALGTSLNVFKTETNNHFGLIEESISTTNGNLTITNENLGLTNGNIGILDSKISSINTELTTSNEAINLRLLSSEYITGENSQNNNIANTYLSKGEFNNYLTTQAIKDLLQGAANAVIEKTLNELGDIRNIVGATLISGGMTLGGQVVNKIDAGFLNLDGRVISNSNAIDVIKHDIVDITTLIDTKADKLIVELSNIRYDNLITSNTNKFVNYYTSQDTDTYLSYKVNGGLFVELSNVINSSNNRYESNILELQNRPNNSNNSVVNDPDFISLSNTVGSNTSNIDTKISTTLYNTNNVNLNNSISLKFNISDQTVFSNVINSSNNRYDSNILALQNRPSSSVNTDPDFISLSNIVGSNTSNINTKVSTTLYNTNNTNLNNSIALKVNGSLFNELSNVINTSNIRYDSNILALQNRPSSSVNTDPDFITLSNLVDTKANINNVFLRWQTYDRTSINDRVDIKLNITDFNSACNLINTNINTKANSSDVYNKDNTYTKSGIDNRLALKVDISAYNIDINQINSNVTTASNIEISALVLSSTNAVGLVTAGTAISLNTLNIVGINTLLPSKLPIMDFEEYKYSANISFNNRYTNSESDSLMSLKVDIATYNNNNSNITNSMAINTSNINLKYNISDHNSFSNIINSSNNRYNSNLLLKVNTSDYNTNNIVINSNINLKTNTTDFTILNSNVNSSNIRYDSNIINVASNLLLKTNQSDFTILNSNVNSSNLRYDSNIINVASNLLLKTNQSDFTILNSNVINSNLRYDSNIINVASNLLLKTNQSDYNLNNVNISSNISLKTNQIDYNLKKIFINSNISTLNTRALATDVYALGLNDKVDLKENILNNDIKLLQKANLSGANFTGIVSTPNIQNVESQILQIANYTGIPIVSNLKFLEADYSQHFDAFMTNSNLDLYTLRLPFNQQIPYGSVVNLSAEPIVNRLGSAFAEYRFINNMDFSGKGNYLTYTDASEDLYKIEPLTDKSYVQFDDGMIQTLLDPVTIQHTIFGGTGLNTGMVISFDFKNITDSGYQKIFSIGDYYDASRPSNTETECEGISILFNSTNMRVRFGRLGNFRRTFTLDIFNTINIWRHYDVVISSIGQVDIYIDNILQTYITTGSVITLLRLFTATNLTTNLLQIYANTCYLSDFKIFLKGSLTETLIDDLTLAIKTPFGEYLLYDNTDTSGRGNHLSGTITEQGRDIDGKQYFRKCDISAILSTETSRTVASSGGGTGFIMSFDIKLYQTGTNQTSVVFGIGSPINGNYIAGTNSIGTGLSLRILNNNRFQFLFSEPNGYYSQVHTFTSSLSVTEWSNITIQIPRSSSVDLLCWLNGTLIQSSVSGQDIYRFDWGWSASDGYKFRIFGNYTDSPYIRNFKIWLTDTITSSDIVNGRLDQVDPPMTISIVKQSQKFVDFRIQTINNSYMNFLNNYNNLLIRASLISKQNVLLSSAIDLNTISIPPTAFFKGTLTALYDIIGNLSSPTTTAFAVIFPNTTYLQAIKFEKFTVNNNANVQFPIRDLDRFDVKDYSFSYIYVNNSILPYSYDLILSIGFATILDSPMPSELEFIRDLSFVFQNIPGSTSVNVDINTLNTSTGLDYLTIENVTYTLGGFTRFDFTISKTKHTVVDD